MRKNVHTNTIPNRQKLTKMSTIAKWINKSYYIQTLEHYKEMTINYDHMNKTYESCKRNVEYKKPEMIYGS